MSRSPILLTAHRLTFHCETTTDLALPQFPGAAIRGALISALRRQVCVLHGAGRPGGQEYADQCPVCEFIAPVDQGAQRGQDLVRLFTIEPPVVGGGFHPAGWSFAFGLTLWGPAAALFPYLAIAAQTMGQIGFGRRIQAPGRFYVWECRAHNAIGDKSERIMDAQSARIIMPPLPIDHEAVMAHAESVIESCGGPANLRHIAVRFLTPARLVTDGHLSNVPHLAIVLRRIFRRLTDLSDAIHAPVPVSEFQELLALSEQIQVAENRTRWVDLTSHSSRTGRSTPIGGLVGEVVYEGELAPFLPWLVWGEIAHVGKDTTKGNGWYRLRRVDPPAGGEPQRIGGSRQKTGEGIV